MSHRDQASDLRRLAADATLPGPGPHRPRLVVLGSGKGGAGTTTLAVNLAAALAQQGRRVLLVDADPQGGNAGLLCGIEDVPPWDDVLDGRWPLAEALRLGPGGMHVLAGRWPAQGSRRPSTAALRLLRLLAAVQPRPEITLIDAGNGPDRLAAELWSAADRSVMVSTPDAASLMNTYALVKLLGQQKVRPAVSWLVNFALWPHSAEAVHARLIRACQRFLGIQTTALGWVPHDLSVPQAAQTALPLVLSAPQSVAALALRPLAERLAAQVFSAKTGESPESQKSTQPVPPRLPICRENCW